MYTHPPLSICNYTTPANPVLLDAFDLQVENYSTKDYQTPKVARFCTDFLAKQGFSAVLSFDPHDDNSIEAEHIRAYKCLRQGLRAFELNGGHLTQLEKPLGAREWILAQQIRKDQEQMEEAGRDEELLVSEVETDDEKEDRKDKDKDKDKDNDDDDDDGLLLNIDPALWNL